MTMTKEDLGNGFSLVYQTGAGGHRAVVKQADGTIVARGPVVSEKEIGRSKFMAVSEWMATHMPEPQEPEYDGDPDDFDPIAHGEEDDEEDDLDDDDDEELL